MLDTGKCSRLLVNSLFPKVWDIVDSNRKSLIRIEAFVQNMLIYINAQQSRVLGPGACPGVRIFDSEENVSV
jgi:hypothetical protein